MRIAGFALAGVVVIVGVSGCSSSGTPTATPLEGRKQPSSSTLAWRGASASITTAIAGQPEDYSYTVTAHLEPGRELAWVQGPVMEGSSYPGKIFFNALARPDSHPRIDVNDALNAASIDALVTVEWCVDEAGGAIVAGCPLGKLMTLKAAWEGDGDMENFSNADDSTANRVRGRLATAKLSISEVGELTSSYAEITENEVESNE
jgi:hypothetical protein